MLEVIIQSGDLSRCHIESIKNKIIVNVEVCWGDGREKIVLKSHSCDEFDGTTAKWDADINLLQFGCPAVLPENATIQVIVKEKGIRDDHHVNPFVRLGKGLVGGVQILEEAVQGRGTKAVGFASCLFLRAPEQVLFLLSLFYLPILPCPTLARCLRLSSSFQSR